MRFTLRLPSVAAWARLHLHQIAWLGGLTLLALGGLYYSTRTRVHTFDAVSYMWNVEAKPYAELFHPHHLLYAPLGQAVYRLAQANGYVGHSDAPIQAVNAIAGALGLVFLWRFGARWTRRPWAALGVALMIGTCYAYWLYAAEVEVYTLSTAFLTLALWALVLLDDRPHPAWAVALGVAHGGAVMFHQTNALFVLPLGVFLLSRPALRRIHILSAYALSVGLTVLIPYGLVAHLSRFPDWMALYNWLTGYAQTGRWGGYLGIEHLPALWAGLRNAVSVVPALSGAVYALAAIGFGLSLVAARRDPRRRAWLAFGLTWLIVYGAFFWWWEPWNIEFWIATLPLMGFWILGAWAADDANLSTTVPFTGQLKPAQALPVLYGLAPFVLAGLLYSANRQPILKAGDPDNDYYYRMTTALQAILQPADLVVTRGNILDVYLPFYAQHPVILSMRELDYRFGGERGPLMSELIAQLDWAQVTGQALLIDSLILTEPRSPDHNPFGLLPEEMARLKERYPLSPIVELDGAAIFYGTPRFDDREAAAWAFVDSLQGWNAWGMNQPRFERDGWCLTGGPDPQLKGPLIQADADRLTRLELDLTLDADQSVAQIFWRAPDGDYSLENSVEVTLTRGRQTYRVDLAGAPGWNGVIGQMRLDPLPGADSASVPVTACLHAVRLLP